MASNRLYARKDSRNIVFEGLASGEVELFVKQANKVSIKWSEEDGAKAKNHGVETVSFPGQKKGTMTMEMELTSPELEAFMSRSKYEAVEREFALTKEFKVEESTKTVLFSDLEGTLVKVLNVFIAEEDDTKASDITNTAVKTEESKIDLTEAIGKKVQIFYKTKMVKKGYSIKTQNDVTQDFKVTMYSYGKCQLNGEDGLYVEQLYKVSPTFDYENAADATGIGSFSFTFDILADNDGKFYDSFSMFDEDAPVIETNQVYVGGILHSDKDTLVVTEGLLAGMDKTEGVTDTFAVQAKADKINGKSIMIIASRPIAAIIDATNLDITSDYTLVEKELNGETYFVAYETSADPNTASDVDMSVKITLA